MVVKRVWIEPGCILCGQSVEACPAVFEIEEGSDTARVKPDADVETHDAEVREAAAGCPVQVIHFEEG